MELANEKPANGGGSELFTYELEKCGEEPTANEMLKITNRMDDPVEVLGIPEPQQLQKEDHKSSSPCAQKEEKSAAYESDFEELSVLEGRSSAEASKDDAGSMEHQDQPLCVEDLETSGNFARSWQPERASRVPLPVHRPEICTEKSTSKTSAGFVSQVGTESGGREPLQDVIRQYAQLDLKRDEIAFADWLARKNRTQSPISPHTSVHSTASKSFPSLAHHQTPLIQPKNLNESIQDPEALAKRTERNQKAVSAWVARKRAQMQSQSKQEAERRAKALADLAEEEHKKEIRQQRIQREVARWARAKEEMEERMGEKAIREERERQEEEQKRREMGQQAFEAWKKGKMEMDKKRRAEMDQTKRENIRPVCTHRNAWTDIVALPDRVRPSVPRKQGQSSSIILSPPHLYNDYNLYAEKAPNYLRKYRILVASAGMDLHKDRGPSSKRSGKATGVNKKTGHLPNSQRSCFRVSTSEGL
ncbi:uncharacterized protein SPPG_07292 [Spizellomyces punctatus DAOM BR117]|uniref:Uncharacterized protein n=1 Tax=Spizellomyces punctatus (strain DAOM BR117) TaxID=645134 RepID=A0A0L0H761_SPIPD|nr:uncharacterized protein SPPG_07292 [Spizellomyces punctatus DAOM BR117]KNC97365.1 hypothetical protein SPPG_07292 [Spizellomyces punctatus DAOM BR117]|eukprot:XP_016605405.1 hypothetical protein SPPG_07292 [Spizellomyces punctatus DAOM BR117]